MTSPSPLSGSPRRAASLGLLLFLCAGVADGAMLPFFPLWAESAAHIPVAAIGLLFACYSGGELIAAPLIGGLADRIGRRPVLLCSAMGIGIGLGALSLASGVWSAAAFLLLAGLAESVFHPTIMAMIADVTPAPRHSQWFARLRVASSCGAILGPLLGAMLASLSLRLVFLGVGATLLAAALGVLLLAPETRPEEGAEEEEEDSLAALLPAFRDRRMGGMLIWFLLFEIAGNWIETILPLYAHDRGLMSPSGVGLLFGYAAALTVCLQMAVSRYLDGIAALRLTLGAGALTIMGLLLMALGPAQPLLILAVSLCALAQMVTGPMIPSAVATLAPPRRRASYMAASSVVNDLRESLGSAIGTALYALAPRLPWLIGIPLVTLAALGLGRALHGVGRDGRSRSDAP